MISYNSYDSRYPLEYYEIGEKYLFYKGSNHSNYREATDEELQAHFRSFNAEDQETSGKVVLLKFNRLVGIVIDKNIDEHRQRISVLFNDKTVWDYVVGFSGVFFDGQEREIEKPIFDFGSLPPSSKAGIRDRRITPTVTEPKAVSTGIAPDTNTAGVSTGIAPDTNANLNIKGKKSTKESTGIAPDSRFSKTKEPPEEVADMETGEIVVGIAPDSKYSKTKKPPEEVADMEIDEIITGIAPDKKES